MRWTHSIGEIAHSRPVRAMLLLFDMIKTRSHYSEISGSHRAGQGLVICFSVDRVPVRRRWTARKRCLRTALSIVFVEERFRTPDSFLRCPLSAFDIIFEANTACLYLHLRCAWKSVIYSIAPLLLGLLLIRNERANWLFPPEPNRLHIWVQVW